MTPGQAQTGCGKTRLACHSEESRSDRDDEESRIVLKTLRARFLAQFTLNGQGEIPRFARNDSEGLGMTAWKGFSASCQALANECPNRLLKKAILLSSSEVCRAAKIFPAVRGVSVSSMLRRASTRRSLRGSVCSVLKLERHGGRREPRLGWGHQPRCNTAVTFHNRQLIIDKIRDPLYITQSCGTRS
jgi:hypothetical protein